MVDKVKTALRLLFSIVVISCILFTLCSIIKTKYCRVKVEYVCGKTDTIVLEGEYSFKLNEGELISYKWTPFGVWVKPISKSVTSYKIIE